MVCFSKLTNSVGFRSSDFGGVGLSQIKSFYGILIRHCSVLTPEKAYLNYDSIDA